jgi:hypothetical protein
MRAAMQKLFGSSGVMPTMITFACFQLCDSLTCCVDLHQNLASSCRAVGVMEWVSKGMLTCHLLQRAYA